jgi:FixJ family two-component response regulator
VIESSRPFRIAIVDDEPGVRVGLQRLCTALGMEARAYASGHMFLDSLFSPVTADCVLLDMHMPEMGGIEVQRRMTKITDSVAVIALTADDSPETSVKWRTDGALACLRKPIGVDELSAVIEVVTEWHRRRCFA